MSTWKLPNNKWAGGMWQLCTFCTTTRWRAKLAHQRHPWNWCSLVARQILRLHQAVAMSSHHILVQLSSSGASHRRLWIRNVRRNMCLKRQAFARSGASANSGRNVTARHIDATALPMKCTTFVCESMAPIVYRYAKVRLIHKDGSQRTFGRLFASLFL